MNVEATPAEVGARIAYARRAAGMSQYALAEACATSRRNVIRWEQGHNAPRTAALARIATALDVTVEDLIGNG